MGCSVSSKQGKGSTTTIVVVPATANSGFTDRQKFIVRKNLKTIGDGFDGTR